MRVGIRHRGVGVRRHRPEGGGGASKGSRISSNKRITDIKGIYSIGLRSQICLQNKVFCMPVVIVTINH